MQWIVHTLILGSLMFRPPEVHPDLSLECRTLANAKAEPVKMPRATAYLKSGDEGQWLEDRFDVLDMWLSEAVRARWRDDEGNRMCICRIPRKIPGDSSGETRTRTDFTSRYEEAVLGPKDLDSLDEAVYMLSPVYVMRRVSPRRSQRQNMDALWQYETTNENAFVFAFRPRAERRVCVDWYMVSFVSDDLDADEKIDEWLDEVEWVAPEERDGVRVERRKARRRRRPDDRAQTEAELLAEAYRRNVVNYADWHFTSVTNLVVVDNMVEIDRRPFIAALTNGFPRMQAAYRAILPSPLVCDTHIAAMRVFGSKNEYLAYVGSDMKWSAALWSPQHRELVMYLPERGFETLLRTVWHEALHQHLDYACSMIQTPPWFNEGHAELFEHTHFDMDGNVVFDFDPEVAQFIQANAAELADQLPALLAMDYKEFYGGTNEERQMKYRLAWSLAYFLQVGAPEVRFQPFKDLRMDMMKATVRTGRRDEATRAVLTDDLRKILVDEWFAFWRRQ